jgi:regulatory protein
METSDDYARALQVALRYVSFRQRSITEVRRRVGKEFPQPVVEQVLASLTGYGYLDDADFARRWRDSRERRGPRGKFVLQRELRTKGVADNIIDAALEGLDEASSAYRAGEKQARRWLERGTMPKVTFHRKMWNYLRRRGFGSGVAQDTIARLWIEFGTRDGEMGDVA